MPVWRGESLLGKTITVQVEQGFGDISMFARFLPALKALGAKKVVVLQEGSLHYLLGQLDCVDVFTNEVGGGVGAESDYWVGIMSLPYYISLSHPIVKNLFPVTTKNQKGNWGEEGMDLRDYFAAKAMQGLTVGDEASYVDYISEQSHLMADAMMKAREK